MAWTTQTPAAASLDLRLLSGAPGAEMIGIDLSRPPDVITFAAEHATERLAGTAINIDGGPAPVV